MASSDRFFPAVFFPETGGLGDSEQGASTNINYFGDVGAAETVANAKRDYFAEVSLLAGAKRSSSTGLALAQTLRG